MTRILVVDDSTFSRNVVVRALGADNFEFAQARNGQEGCEKVAEFNPDIVISDLLMPVMDGVGLLRTMRTAGDNRPVCIISADIQQSSRETCLELGAHTFINKPFKQAELIDAVESMLNELKGACCEVQ